jgi:hypothetical protein
VLGEFFAARRDEIDDRLVEEGPHGRFPIVEAKVSHVAIATLGEILGAGTYDELALAMEGRGAESGEAALFRVPSQVRDRLAATGDDLDSAAVSWASTEELSLDRWSAEAALEVLRALTQLARQGRAEGRELWYWWSL